jgi:hypothetical protein
MSNNIPGLCPSLDLVRVSGLEWRYRDKYASRLLTLLALLILPEGQGDAHRFCQRTCSQR